MLRGKTVTVRKMKSLVLDLRRSKANLESHLEALEAGLKTAGDDAQLANLDMQNVLLKQQQTMQMMSNICKQLHDTAMAVIRKIGG
jgi:flagellar biosynthesis/type III secretory pathway protein FliH